jgi:hypothetical protein
MSTSLLTLRRSCFGGFIEELEAARSPQWSKTHTSCHFYATHSASICQVWLELVCGFWARPLRHATPCNAWAKHKRSFLSEKGLPAPKLVTVVTVVFFFQPCVFDHCSVIFQLILTKPTDRKFKILTVFGSDHSGRFYATIGFTSRHATRP